MQVNRELLIYCLEAIAEKAANGFQMKAETLIHALSAFQSGIELVENTKKIKTYKVGDMAFRLYCTESETIENVNLFEKDNNKVYFSDFKEHKHKQTSYYPDCLN